MAPKVSKQPRRIGRPPAGARAGEKVKDYPQLSIRLPEDVKAKLQALSAIAHKPQWRIITMQSTVTSASVPRANSSWSASWQGERTRAVCARAREVAKGRRQRARPLRQRADKSGMSCPGRARSRP